MTVTEAAKAALAQYTVTVPPAFAQVEIAPTDGGVVTSDTLLKALRQVAAKDYPTLDVSSTEVQLGWAEAGKPTRFVVSRIWKKG